MPASKSRSFTHFDFLRRIRPRVLAELLASFPDSRKLSSEFGDPENELNYESLAFLLASEPEQLPSDLVEALYQIEEMATERVMAQMVTEARRLEIPLEDGVTAADLAAILWIHDRNGFQRSHAEAKIERRRRFEYFTGEPDAQHPVWSEPSQEQLQALRTDLDKSFDLQMRGKGCRVHYFPRKFEIAFAVCRGDYFRREGVLENGQSSSILYRPEKIDAVYYCPSTHELRINAPSKEIIKTYRRLFGLHLFGNQDAFSVEIAYTLEPLRCLCDSVMTVADCHGIKNVRLVELSLAWPGNLGKNTYASKDVLGFLQHQVDEIPIELSLINAKFEFVFPGEDPEPDRARMVTIRPPNTAMFVRNEDSFRIERWLRKRGFVEFLVRKNRDAA